MKKLRIKSEELEDVDINDFYDVLDQAKKEIEIYRTDKTDRAARDLYRQLGELRQVADNVMSVVRWFHSKAAKSW
jgi:hypothetical protein